MPVRVFIVGTDTGVGKTAVTAALLHTARDRDDLRLLPFKPAQSGEDDPSDTARLLSAADNPAVIANASGVPYLGALAHGPEPATVPALLDALLARLPR